MKAPLVSCLMGLGTFVALGQPPARSAERPLLVVVEAPPALDADAGEIRRAIGSELRAETIAPMKTPADPPERALIVALDREHIAMSLRTNDGAPVARSIPAPPERAARLRAIAWLAGNLARDQVAPILAETPAAASPLATMPALASPAEAAPPPTPPSATEPPPLMETPAITNHPESKPIGPVHWSLALSGGPMTNMPLCRWVGTNSNPACAPDAVREFGSAWRLEVQRHPTRDGVFQGAALEGTNGDLAPQLVGATAFLGSAKHLGRWEVEGTLGIGLEAAQTFVAELTATHSSLDGFMSSITTSNQVRPGLYSDAAIGASHPVSDALDLFLRVGLHATTVDLADWFVSAALGLRYNL
jgi:hypothetical protein